MFEGLRFVVQKIGPEGGGGGGGAGTWGVPDLRLGFTSIQGALII